MFRRTIGNILTVLFVGVSLYFFWPSLVELYPKVVAVIKTLPTRLEAILEQNQLGGWQESSGEQEVKSDPGGNEKAEVGPISSSGIITETNKERAAVGLPELLYNARLRKSAQLKVEDMIKYQYFEHESPSGATVSDLGDEVGYSYITMGENLAMGDFVSDKDVVNAWMKSPGHRANILQEKYKEIGVAAGKGMYEGKIVWFIVQHFGTGRSECPEVNTALKDTIESMRIQTNIIEKQIIELKAELEQPDAPLDPEYDQKVDYYNQLVDQYNALIRQTRMNVDSYNVEVRSFNTCLANYQ